MRAPKPPDYRPSITEYERCGTCKMYDGNKATGICWGYGNQRVMPEYVCDSWTPDPTQKHPQLEGGR